MDYKKFGHKLSAVGTLLAGGSTATALVTLNPTYGLHGTAANIINAIAIVSVVMGVLCSALGKLIAAWTDDDDSAESIAKNFPLSVVPKTALVLATAILFATLTGCASATPKYHEGTSTMATAYEQAIQNDSDLFDGHEKALIASHTKRVDLELRQDMGSLAYQVKLDPAKWSNQADVSAEQVRLQALHDKKIADYAASLAAYRDLKTKNEAINLKTARALRDALNPPKTPTSTVSLTGQIQSSTGAAPAASIIQN